MFHVIFGPLQGQIILGCQLAKTEPVFQGDFRCVGNLHAFLQRRAHQHHAAKGPQRQAAHPFFRVTVRQGYGLTSTQAFKSRDNACQPAADHQNIRGNYLGHIASDPIAMSCQV